MLNFEFLETKNRIDKEKKTLNLDRIKLGENPNFLPFQKDPSLKSMRCLSEFIQKSRLDTLSLRECELQGKHLILLTEGLRKNNTIERLNLGDNFLGAGLKDFSQYIRETKSLKYLDMSSTSLLDRANISSNTSFFWKALAENQTITDLNLNNAYMTPHDFKGLSHVLKCNTTLKSIALDSFFLASAGVCAHGYGWGIQGHPTKNMELIVQGMEKNETVTRIAFGCHEKFMDSVDKLEEIFLRNKILAEKKEKTARDYQQQQLQQVFYAKTLLRSKAKDGCHLSYDLINSVLGFLRNAPKMNNVALKEALLFSQRIKIENEDLPFCVIFHMDKPK